MWIALWAAASAFIICVFVWSTFILHQQKKAWEAFAKKHNLAYIPGKISEAPSIKGAVFGYQVAFFPDAQASPDQRSQRFVTVLEFDVGQGMPTGGIVAAADFATFASSLSFSETMPVEFPSWDATRIVRTRDISILKSYLTPERIEFLHSVMSMKNCAVLYFFDEKNAILHIETSDPISNTERLEKITQKITQSLGKLKMKDAEQAALKPAS